jgi:hypothetical protein
MSLLAAIDLAVRLQLLRDKPGNVHLGDYARVMGGDAATGFEFTEETINAFLQGVANRLKLDTPSSTYNWTRSDTRKCLLANRDVLIGLIASDTILTGGGA